MLTPSEIELLRQSKREIAAASKEAVKKLVTEKRLDA
jgi:HJR/Mrr/RecB family endonuclease